MLKKSKLDKYEKIIIDLVNEGKSVAHIARVINEGAPTVLYYLNARSIKAVHGNSTKAHRESVRESILEDYSKGLSIDILGDKYHVRTDFVYEVLNESGTTRRNRAETRRMSQDLHLDNTFFDNIDLELPSYYLGFIVADGSLTNDGKCLVICVKREDGYILKNLQRLLKMKHGYYEGSALDKRTGNTYHRSMFQIQDPHLIEQLHSQNLAPNKSACEKLPNLDWLNNRHFWRGMIDGDGHVNFTKSATIVFVGSKEIVNGFNSFVEHNMELKTKRKVTCKKYINKTLYRIAFTGDDARNIAKFLYQDCNVSLDRKLQQVMKLEVL